MSNFLIISLIYFGFNIGLSIGFSMSEYYREFEEESYSNLKKLASILIMLIFGGLIYLLVLMFDKKE